MLLVRTVCSQRLDTPFNLYGCGPRVHPAQEENPNTTQRVQPRHQQQTTQDPLALYHRTSVMAHVSQRECSVCNRRHDAGKVQTLCECGGALLVRYDLEKAK